MRREHQKVANWANYPVIQGEVAYPETEAELRSLLLSNPALIARGNGKCYGDAALSPLMVSMLQFKKILAFDAEKGIISCETGLLLSEILPIIVPQGWFFQVSPGIKSISVGGAIASDVHGKNHPEKGCFSQWLMSFDLMRADGQVITCSRESHPDLFWQTCGGMGWTGIILRATFRLMRIKSAQMEQKTLRAANLKALLEAFLQHPDWPYAAAWMDCTASGEHTGRGALFLARHLEHSTENLQYDAKKAIQVPFFAPSWLLNRWTIGWYNRLFHAKQKNGLKEVSLDEYFYPLDRIGHWNRLYGQGGFVQYQFCLPAETAFEGFSDLLQTIQQQQQIPFLSVLKRHGPRPAEAVHSFPDQGFSLALDFPIRHLPFMATLDEMVWKYGGKIYLTKDACSAAKMGRVDPRTFGESKFSSLLKARILKGL
jgi:decaprenylphospho-beta-D-ribofuranose 2-oxidase